MIPDHKISDFNISGDPIPETVADRILEYHIIPMIAVCNAMSVCVMVSLNSGWRSWLWEISKGRSGTSQHTYGQKEDGTFDENAKGATDWTCDDFAHNKDQLLRLMIIHTEYTRFCMYNSFIHCDYKETPNNERQLFEIDNGKWKFIKNV
jgi:hypothetical protein